MSKKYSLKRIASSILAVALLAGTVPCAFASDDNGTKEIVCNVGDNLTIGEYPESAKETQSLIDNRPDVQRRMDDLGRGLVAVATDNGVFVSWKWKGTESLDVKYNLYKNGEKINAEPMSLTNYTDVDGTASDNYAVAAVTNGTEIEKCDEVSVWADGYFEIPLNRPENKPMANGEAANDYKPGDASVADLDGDGEIEIILKWNGTIRDASKAGYTSECLIDAYKLDGTHMWRINMGPNIRSGEHDTQFMVADFDNDGKSEMAVRTADGTIAGDGTIIGDAEAKWYEENNGKNLTGPLYLTVFKGEDGTIIDTIDFFAQSTGKFSDGTEWGIDSWGDDHGNRSERYLGAVASFDGVTTSFIQSRGYYGRTCIGAYHLENDKIVEDWTFDSSEWKIANPESEVNTSGQGYHNMSTADVDFDGKDEVIFGALNLDDDGTVMYSTGLGHGDSMHVGDFVPSRPGMEVYECVEWTKAQYGFYMRDARTGEILYALTTNTDNGRACTADIDPAYEGEEAWSAYGVLTAADGTVISTSYSMPANFAIYWDGDIGREIEDGNGVYKWDPKGEEVNAIFKAVGCHSINAAKSNPSLQADIFGDWREELIFPTDDEEHLRIYTTTTPTAYRIPELMSDGTYRNAVAWQNDCYNQTTHLGYYLGYDTKTIPVPQIYTVDNVGNKVTNPDLSKKVWNMSDLYFGDKIELVPGVATALVNGAKVRVDNNNTDVKPYINAEDRTMVPLRFIAEAYGAEVAYNNDTREITVTTFDKTIKMIPGIADYTVNDESKTMDTVPEIKEDRTFVPLRAISEAMGKYVNYYDGLVYVSTLEKDLTSAEAATVKTKISSTSVPCAVDDKLLIENYNDETSGSRLPYEIFKVTNDADATAVTDFDMSTTFTLPAGGEIIFDMGKWPGIPAIVVAFGDEEEHTFRVEYGNDGEKWQIGIPTRVSDGKSGVFEKFYFGVPPYPKYIKFVSLDDKEMVIAELGCASVE